MKTSELLYPIKMSVIMCEFLVLAESKSMNTINFGRLLPPSPPIVIDINTLQPKNNYRARPELTTYFDFALPFNHPPKPPMRHHNMQHNNSDKPLQPHQRTSLNENNNNFKIAPNSLPRSNDVEEYNKEIEYNDKKNKNETEAITPEPFTTEHTTEVTTDSTTEYFTSTLDEDIGLRIAVPDAVAASLIG